jgi:hypothetical protein
MRTTAKNRSTVIAWIAWLMLSIIGYCAYYAFYPSASIGCG